jgi:hypothetical protein
VALREPFDVVPFEPFISCIPLALPLPEKGYTRGLLQFTMVSGKWRDTIVSNPVLRASITVSHSDPDALATIANLSCDAMITVTSRHSMSQCWGLFCDSIAPHAHRVQRIILEDADLPMKSARTPILQGRLYYLALEHLLGCLGHLPAIVGIDVGAPSHGLYPYDPWTEGFPLPQNVQHMRQWIFQRQALEGRHHLRELHTDEPIDVIQIILPAFLQLERLILSDPVQIPAQTL